jgi:mannose-6-phosphate isomerase-like protein (cupin superfamily)
MSMKLAFTCLLLSFAVAAPIAAQTTRRAAAPAATTTLSITVTDGRGAPINGVVVRATGPDEREAQTVNGALQFEGLRGGSYRLRFTREGFITLERDITVSAGQRMMDQRAMLSPGEKPATPPPPPAPAPEASKPAVLPPPGKAMNVSLPDFIEKNFITASQPQKATAVACSGLTQTTLWQVRESWTNRQHPGADAMLYVVGGEGSLLMEGRDVPLQAGTFAVVPRGTSYALSRRGRNPLIVLATLAGEPCQ